MANNTVTRLFHAKVTGKYYKKYYLMSNTSAKFNLSLKII